MKKTILLLLALFTFLTMMPMAAVHAEGPALSPVAWYDFENTSDLGKDKTGNGNDLLTLGEPLWEVGGPSGKLAYFDGQSALYAKTDENGVDFVDAIDISGSRKLTIAYWIENELDDYSNFDTNSWRRIISNGHDGGAMQESVGNAFGGFTMLSLADQYIMPTIVNPAIMVDRVERHDGWCTGNTTIYSYEDSKWFFIVWTADATTGQFCYYVNGEKIYDKTYDPSEYGGIKMSNVARPFSIANNTWWNADSNEFDINMPYTGRLDEVMVFDGILGEEDIAYYRALTGADLPEETEPAETEPPVTIPRVTRNHDTTVPETIAPVETEPVTETPAPETEKPAEPSDEISIWPIVGIAAAVIGIAVVAAVVIAKKKKS